MSFQGLNFTGQKRDRFKSSETVNVSMNAEDNDTFEIIRPNLKYS